MFLFIISFLKDTIIYLYLLRSNPKILVIHEDRKTLPSGNAIIELLRRRTNRYQRAIIAVLHAVFSRFGSRRVR